MELISNRISQPRNRATAQPRNRATAQPRNRATAQPRPNRVACSNHLSTLAKRKYKAIYQLGDQHADLRSKKVSITFGG